MASVPRWRRWRWRVRGAWQWPAFAVFLVGDVVLLSVLPPSGDSASLTGAFVIGGVLNLVIVGVLGPLAGALLRRRRRDLPRVVANDYAGAVLLSATFLALLGFGLANRHRLTLHDREFRVQSDAVREYVGAVGPAVYRRNLDRADSTRVETHLYRTCVPGADSEHSLCFFVDTSKSPPGLRRDTNGTPNWRLFGPGNPGRLGG